MPNLLHTNTSAAKQPPLVTNQQLENYLCTDLKEFFLFVKSKVHGIIKSAAGSGLRASRGATCSATLPALRASPPLIMASGMARGAKAGK